MVRAARGRGGCRVSLVRLLAIARKEVIQLRRDPRSVALAFVLPLIMLLIFGYAITLDITNIRVAVFDEDFSPQSRRLVDAFVASRYFTVADPLHRYAEIEAVLDGGRARLVLAIGPDFSADLEAGRPALVQLLLDGSDANTASIAMNYADAIIGRYSAEATGRKRGAGVVVESRVLYNETLQSQAMIVPGLIAVIMSIIASMLTSLTIAREWERGTMEQLAATPVHRLEVIFGKLLPYLGIGLIDVAVTCVLAVGLFAVPLRGSVPLLFGMTVLFLLGALGWGIFLSALMRSQMLATQFTLVSTYLPALLLSGFIFAIASMPTALQAISYIVPARYFVIATRGIFLKGVGLDVLWHEAVGLAIFAAVGIALATRVFRKELA